MLPFYCPIIKQQYMDLTTMSHPQTSLMEKKNGKWKKSWGQGGLDAGKSYSIKSDGRAILQHITLGN